VKIRGFRVELGEIEAAVRSHPDLAEAAVVVVEKMDGERQLQLELEFFRQRAEQREIL
jgi:acyl-coenzyme A synthetase/AMP-(fatty) acid ligase